MQKALPTIIVVLSLLVCVLGYSTYHYASAQTPKPLVTPSVDTTDELYPYEMAYQTRIIKDYQNAKQFRNPLWGAIYSDSVAKDIVNYAGDKGKNFALRSVWVDDTTILHFAYCLLHNKSNDTLADGVRFILEEYRYAMTLPSGTAVNPSDVSLALVATRNVNGKHVNWFSDKIFETLKPNVTSDDAPPYDNYNDPCPPSTTNCLSFPGN